MGNSRLRFQKTTLLRAILICLSLILPVSSPVFADTLGPTFSGIFPGQDAVISSGSVTITLTVTDSDEVNATTVNMKVDGAAVTPIRQYGWIDEWTDDYTTLNIYYPANLANGVHNVEVSVKDRVGNVSTLSWSFTVAQPPQISSLTPADGATVADRRPLISAVIKDNPTMDAGSVTMTLDGDTVRAGFDPVTGKVSYIPPADLANETTHTVTLAVQDASGNTTQARWNFTVNTYREMTFPVDDNACQKCHSRTTHPVNSCGKCHGTNLDPYKPVYPLDDCYKCHYNSGNYPASYHSNGLPVSVKPDHPVQTTDSCVGCHAGTWTTGIPPYHGVTNTAERHRSTSTGCDTCHAVALTREHQRRTDSSGNALTCYTCHLNTQTRVTTAIETKDSSCSACHDLGPTGGHPAHNNGLDSYCQTCHSDSILSEPQFHRSNGCEVCHSPGAKDIVKYSISVKNTSCFSCHEQGHNVNFVQMVPEDIPQYPGFRWSVPQDARIWAGEPWFKAEYNTAGAKFLVSDRRQSVSGPEVYAWYDQNLTAAGWTRSEGPAEGSDNFAVTYTKGNRMVTVYFYGGETRDPAAQFIGYRLEILYK